MTKSEKEKERIVFIRSLIKRVAVTHPIKEQVRDCGAQATDEEVRDFIRIFMRPTITRRNTHHSSYSLKHITENAIGYIFYGSSSYNYVSNDQFKRIMREDEFRDWYWPKPLSSAPVNENYCFRWAEGAEHVFAAFGVYGYHQTPLR